MEDGAVLDEAGILEVVEDVLDGGVLEVDGVLEDDDGVFCWVPEGPG